MPRARARKCRAEPADALEDERDQQNDDQDEDDGPDSDVHPSYLPFPFLGPLLSRLESR